jgi:hypothetical protein
VRTVRGDRDERLLDHEGVEPFLRYRLDWPETERTAEASTVR